LVEEEGQSDEPEPGLEEVLEDESEDESTPSKKRKTGSGSTAAKEQRSSSPVLHLTPPMTNKYNTGSTGFRSSSRFSSK